VRDPLNRFTKYTYDASGNVTSVIDPRGKTTQFTYDPVNQVSQITDAINGVTGFTYDPNGNLLTLTDAKNQTTTYTYDNMDRLATRKDALNRTESYQYDLAGNLTQFTDRKNQVANFQYDALNRRTQVTYADATTTFTYDTAGRLIKASDTAPGAGTIDFAYDILNRLVQETTPQGTVAYQYDVLGRRTQMTANGQQPTVYQYDAASRLIQVAQGSLTVGLGYDNANRRTLLTYPNGTNTSYSYDLASRLTNITHNGPSGVIEALKYTYDGAGNRVSLMRNGANASLLPAAVASASYDAANEQTAYAGTTLTYDNNGNLTTDGTNTYQWDARNRLMGLSGGSTASFAYDPLGRRINKTINGVSTQFAYDGNDITAEIGSSTVGTTYLRSLNIDEVFGFLRQDGVYFSIYDGIGSTLALTNQSGAPAVQYTYEPFGMTQSSNPSFANPFQFTGRENDGTGLVYYRARYYSPYLSRFLTEDPLHAPMRKSLSSSCQVDFTPDVSWYVDLDPGSALLLMYRLHPGSQLLYVNPQSIPLYTYVYNNPVNKMDPTGLYADPQTRGCDNFPDFNPCATKCCDAHDACYLKGYFSRCTQTTWLEQFFPYGRYASRTRLECEECNSAAIQCMARATWHWRRKGPC